MDSIMKARYIQPEIDILKVYGKEAVMDPSLHDVSVGAGASAGNGGGRDVKMRDDAFDEKDITYGNIW